MKFLSGICLFTDEVRKLAAFYQAVLQTNADLNDVHVVIPVEDGGITIYAKSAAEKDMGFDFTQHHGTGLFKFTFVVNDVDAEYERLKALNLGIAFDIVPTTYPWGARSMHFRDLDGNLVCFINGSVM